MYLAARGWGIQPGEFWDNMTPYDWFLEAMWRYEQSDEGRAAKNKSRWLAQMEMTDEEWWGQNAAT